MATSLSLKDYNEYWHELPRGMEIVHNTETAYLRERLIEIEVELKCTKDYCARLEKINDRLLSKEI